ncbi:MAG: amidohydrolase [Ruminococcaceae bacterium]|nr:amidohydrolase [Oscillospiraceae bacterium]
MINTILRNSKELSQKLIEHRRFLHQNAEVGFDTIKTSKYIYDTLCTLGVECRFLGKNAVVGDIKGEKNGKTVLLRADIDALPITEQTGLSYACKLGNMHACGHDMHAAMLLGAAELLQSVKHDFCGNIRLLFQPAEEILSGAEMTIKNGVLDGVDYAMTLHVMTASDIATGSILLSYDSPSAPSADFFEMKITGKGCHGSSPSIGIDPITCACRIVSDLQHIKAYELGIHDKAVLTFGQISGGNSANAIPDEVTLRGTLRCFDENTRAFYKQRFEEISQCIAKAFRCKCKIKYTSGCPSLINNQQLLARTAHNMTELLGEENVIKIKDTKSKIQGSEDFAYISQAVPSVSVAIAAGSIKDGFTLPLHNPKVTFDERALEVGCKVFAYNAIKLLTTEE